MTDIKVVGEHAAFDESRNAAVNANIEQLLAAKDGRAMYDYVYANFSRDVEYTSIVAEAGAKVGTALGLLHRSDLSGDVSVGVLHALVDMCGLADNDAGKALANAAAAQLAAKVKLLAGELGRITYLIGALKSEPEVPLLLVLLDALHRGNGQLPWTNPAAAANGLAHLAQVLSQDDLLRAGGTRAAALRPQQLAPHRSSLARQAAAVGSLMAAAAKQSDYMDEMVEASDMVALAAAWKGAADLAAKVDDEDATNFCTAAAKTLEDALASIPP